MAQFEDIRRGLAANLTTLTDFEGGIELYLLDSPKPPVIQIAGITEIEYDIVFQGADGYQNQGDQLTVDVEAVLRRNTDIGPQKLLDRLHGDLSVKAALESDPQLTSRLSDSGSVLGGQDAACDSLRVTGYGWVPKHTLEDGTEVGLATWTVQILT